MNKSLPILIFMELPTGDANTVEVKYAFILHNKFPLRKHFPA